MPSKPVDLTTSAMRAYRCCSIFLEEQARDFGEPIEMDVVALCCEWSEASLDQVNDDYSLVDAEDYEYEDDRWLQYAIFEALSERTTAYHVDSNTVVYQQF